MRSVFLFMMASLDGFFEGPNHDLSWHNVDTEFNQFAAKQMNEMGMILFGHRTYNLMADYWPSAKPFDEYDEIVAGKMNSLPKVVVSKTMQRVDEKSNWKHIMLIKNNLEDEIEKLKSEDGKPIALLGSNNLSVQLLELGLLDEVRIMINPIAIGAGTRLFEGLHKKVQFQLIDTKTFNSGNILLFYRPRK